eukprot:gene20590-27388_t
MVTWTEVRGPPPAVSFPKRTALGERTGDGSDRLVVTHPASRMPVERKTRRPLVIGYDGSSLRTASEDSGSLRGASKNMQRGGEGGLGQSEETLRGASDMQRDLEGGLRHPQASDLERDLRPSGGTFRGGSDTQSDLEKNRLLIHSCCAPCSGAMFKDFLSKGLQVTVFFYNPNIHPREEYVIRKEENKRFCQKHDVPFVDCDYDSDSWFERTKGQEFEPERGSRCTACFDLRMEVTAAYANEHGFQIFTTTNAASRWKDLKQVNASGYRAAAMYQGLEYWGSDFQTDEMTRLNLRDSNIWRKTQGIPPCKIGGEEAGLGTRYFEYPVADAEEESQEVVDTFFSDAERHFDDERLTRLYEGRKKVAGADIGKNNCNAERHFDDMRLTRLYEGGKREAGADIGKNNW